jgi:hypothetical protein
MDIPDIVPQRREPLSERYCHCIWKVRGRGYNPYAVCSSSIYNARGLKGPGAVRCKVSREFLETLPDSALRAFLREKGTVDRSKLWSASRQQLLQVVLDELMERDELLPDT